jgi:hypothetical protein
MVSNCTKKYNPDKARIRKNKKPTSQDLNNLNSGN